MAVNTWDDFIGVLQKSKLLTPEQLAEARRATQGITEPTQIARKLVQQNLLSPWQAGRLLDGKHSLRISKYRLLDLLGTEPLGPVYLAEHTQMDRRVVLKTLARRGGNSSASIERFLGEAQALASLDHRNLSHVYDVDREGDFYYLVMEYVQGRSLQQIVEAEAPLSCESAAGFVALAADALSHAHQRGIDHLGIRPDRLVVDVQGTLKVLDIGVARLSDAELPAEGKSNGAGNSAGFDYLAPEQVLRQGSPDQRTDVYALGCVFYYLLASQAPFVGTEDQRREQKCQQPAPDVRARRRDVPSELAEVCVKMMARRPQDRYPTAAAVASALETWLKEIEAARATARAKPAAARPRAEARGGEAENDIFALPTEPRTVAPRRTSRRPLIIGAGVGSAFALLAVMLAIVFGMRSTSKPPATNAAQAAATHVPEAGDTGSGKTAGPSGLAVDGAATTGSTQAKPLPGKPIREAEKPSPLLETANVLAYWRFEGGKPGQPLPDVISHKNQPAAEDASGSGNHLYAASKDLAPRFSSQVAAATVPGTGKPNQGSLDDTQAPPEGAVARGLATDSDRSKPKRDLKRAKLAAWTLEASFSLARLGQSHGLLGKDGRTNPAAPAPLQLRVRGDNNHIEIEACDAFRKKFHSILSRDPIVAGRWYHVAVVSNGHDLQLWLDSLDGHGFQSQGTTPFAGPLLDGPGAWCIGRGFADGGPADDAMALIDEVRITADALKPEQFLWHATDQQLAAARPAQAKPTSSDMAPSPGTGPIQFQPLEILELKGPIGTDLQRQRDDSIFVSGAGPKAVYTIRARTMLAGIRGFRLEALTDHRLPHNGPGNDSGRPGGNFCVTRFSVQAAARAVELRPATVHFARAEADISQFGQEGLDVAAGINTDRRARARGWAIDPQAGHGHWAMFTADEPLGYPGGTWLTITIEQNLGKELTLGRFRVTAFTGDKPGQKPDEGIVSAERLANPFSELGTAVELPALSADANSAPAATTTTPTPLGQIFCEPQDPIKVRLLGTNTADENGTAFRLIPNPPAEQPRRWQVELLPAGAANDAGRAVAVAVIELADEKLQFQWNADAAKIPAANQLRNCLLEIKVEKLPPHGLALREPIKVRPLDLGVGKGSARDPFDIPWPPKAESLKVELLPDDKKLPPFIPGLKILDTKTKSTEIVFSQDKEFPLIVNIEAILRHNKQQLNAALFIMWTPSRRQTFSRLKLEQMGQQASKEQRFLTARAEQLKLAKDKQEGLARQQLASVDATLKQLLALLKRFEAIDAAGPLRFRVFVTIATHKVVLAEAAAD